MNIKSLALTALVGFVSLSLGSAPALAKSKAKDVAPPAADETLIHMIRIGRFVGAAAGYWVAVNDKTVSRLRNKKYATIRAKAGTITLNLATQGIVVGAIQVDNRPGEIVYLKFRLGDKQITEIDAAEGKKLLKKYKQMKPIKEVKSNNEELLALINMGRLGFGLMQPATQKLEPDSENAVITFFRHKEVDKFNLGVWGEDRYLGDLDENQSLEIKVPAGEHYFLAGNVGKSLLRAQVEAGKRYLVWVNLGNLILRVKLAPIENKKEGVFEEKLAQVSTMELNTDLLTPGIREREDKMSTYMAQLAAKAKAGTVDLTSMNAAHAF